MLTRGDHAEYGLDLLVHGLYSLGYEIVDFPPKGLYHHGGFPCFLSSRIPAHNLSLQEIKRGRYDFVLAGTMALSPTEGQLEIIACIHAPVICVNAEDNYFDSDYWTNLFGERIIVELVREWPKDLAMPNGRSMPFNLSFKEENFVAIGAVEKNATIFFAGELRDELTIIGIKRRMAGKIIRDFGGHFVSGNNMGYDAYRRSLAGARCGISIRGGGWDTIRYWEIPGFGSCLVSERVGERIRIIDDFKNGEEALFFDFHFGGGFYEDIFPGTELSEVMSFITHNPDVVERIAKRGQEKLLDCHTTVRRAQYVMREAGL